MRLSQPFGIALLCLLSTQAVADTYITLGHGFRYEAYNVAVGHHLIDLDNAKIGVEAEFASMGQQPPGYPNINRMVNLTGIVHSHLGGNLYGFGKFGINNTRFSHNGTNDYDRAKDTLWGYAASVGLEYRLTDNVHLHGGVQTHEYRQVNNPNMGGFTYPHVGVRVLF